MYVFLYSSLPLGDGRQALEDDIDEVLGNAGEVTGGGAGTSSWNVDIEIYKSPAATDQLEKLKIFLRNWPVPQDTILDVDGERQSLF